MANTTNFGWETPDDTDLVKDGALAMRTLGNAIDTSLVDLKGGSSGQILAKNSNSDMDFVWIANDQGDITAVNAGTGISGGGTTGAVTITNTVATTFDAAGDLLVGTGSDTWKRLAIGTAGQVLKVNSGANDVEWGAAAVSSFVGCVLANSTTQSIANNTDQALTWDTETIDTDGFHSTSTNTSRITIPSGKGGKYRVTANLVFDNATGQRVLKIYKNGSSVAEFVTTGSTAYPSGVVTFILDLVATDYIEIMARQNSGTNQTVYFTGGQAQFAAEYLGA